VGLTTGNGLAQKKTIKGNDPLPSEYAGKLDKIYLSREIKTVAPGMLVSAKTPMVGLVLSSLAQKSQGIKEKEIAKSKALENDSATLVDIVSKVYSRELKDAGMAMEQGNTEYTLNVMVFDHGFTWATSSKAGVFIRIKTELLSADGNVLWEQLYYMEKGEAKQLHNQGAINLNKSVDKLIRDYEKDPELLPKTYEQICNMLAVKLIN
jgi:hypothetical protein